MNDFISNTPLMQKPLVAQGRVDYCIARTLIRTVKLGFDII